MCNENAFRNRIKKISGKEGDVRKDCKWIRTTLCDTQVHLFYIYIS